jgi:integrase
VRGVADDDLSTTGRQTLAQYLAGWLKHRQAQQDIRARTYYSYRAFLQHAVRDIGMIALEDLRPITIQRFYNGLTKRLSASSLSCLHVALRDALDDAVKDDFIGENPAAGATVPHPPKKTGRRHLTWDELAALLEVGRGTRWYAMWAVLGTMGLRVGEAIALRWEDVDWQERTITVDETLTQGWSGGLDVGPPKTESSGRTVTMTDTVYDALEAHKRILAREGRTWGRRDWVFPSVHSKRLHPSVVAKNLRDDCAAAGLERISPHVLRHTCATLMLDSGTPMHVVKDALGHASVQMTVDLYGHTDASMRQAAAARIDARLRKGS